MGAFLDPLTMGFSTAGTVFKAQGAKANAEAIADASRYNASLAVLQGNQAAARLRRAARRAASSEAVRIAASGVQLEGSPMDRLIENVRERELEALDVQIAAKHEATLERTRAKEVERQGRMLFGAELLSGAARLTHYGRSLI